MDKLLYYKDKIFSVAPMMDWTDRHCRVFHRVLSRHAVLYTEMVTALAIKHGDRQKLLGFDAVEQPVVLQLGGSAPEILAEAARIGEDFGYAEINFNVGCPSDRVRGGHFGACLMAEPKLVAECISAMQGAVKIPVTVKCRIGIDEQDEDQALRNFVDAVSGAGCTSFTVHARKAWLRGLSPKENREIPPLNYPLVHRLKAEFPELHVSINGGLENLDQAMAHLEDLDGVMLGRAAYHNPWILSGVDEAFGWGQGPVATRREAVEKFLPYVEEERARGMPLHRITRHMLGLYHGQPGGRIWRQILTVEGAKARAGTTVILKALAAVETQAARQAEAA